MSVSFFFGFRIVVVMWGGGGESPRSGASERYMNGLEDSLVSGDGDSGLVDL